MPVCPNCKEEYVDGITTCADCGTPLVEKLPEHKQDEPSKPALLAVIENGMDAQAAEALLRGEGIPVFARNAVSHRPTVITGITGSVALFVPEECLETARDVLRAMPALDAALEPGAAEAEPDYIPPEELLDEKPASRKAFIWIMVILLIFIILAFKPILW